MLLVEIVLVLVLAAFIMSGVKVGFFVSLGKMLGAVLGFVIARAWYAGVGSVIAIVMPAHVGIARLIAFMFLFILVDSLVGLVFKLLSSLFGLMKFIPFTKTISRVLGGLLGFFEGVVLVGATVYVIMHFRLDPSLMAWVSSSSVAHFTQSVFQAVLGFLL